VVKVRTGTVNVGLGSSSMLHNQRAQTRSNIPLGSSRGRRRYVISYCLRHVPVFAYRSARFSLEVLQVMWPSSCLRIRSGVFWT